MKLLTFDNLSEAYSRIQKLGSQRLEALNIVKEESNNNKFNNSWQAQQQVKIDFSSVKNQQHMLLQKEIESNYNINK